MKLPNKENRMRDIVLNKDIPLNWLTFVIQMSVFWVILTETCVFMIEVIHHVNLTNIALVLVSACTLHWWMSIVFGHLKRQNRKS